MSSLLIRRISLTCAAFSLFAAAGPALADSSDAVARAHEAVRDHRYDLALTHYRDAAEQGNRYAQRTLAMMLLKGEALYGREVATDRAEAIKWFTAAADKGCGVSKFMLSRLLGGNAPTRS